MTALPAETVASILLRDELDVSRRLSSEPALTSWLTSYTSSGTVRSADPALTSIVIRRGAGVADMVTMMELDVRFTQRTLQHMHTARKDDDRWMSSRSSA